MTKQSKCGKLPVKVNPVGHLLGSVTAAKPKQTKKNVSNKAFTPALKKIVLNLSDKYFQMQRRIREFIEADSLAGLIGLLSEEPYRNDLEHCYSYALRDATKFGNVVLIRYLLTKHIDPTKSAPTDIGPSAMVQAEKEAKHDIKNPDRQTILKLLQDSARGIRHPLVHAHVDRVVVPLVYLASTIVARTSTDLNADRESTHDATVHRDAADSALRLAKRYGNYTVPLWVALQLSDIYMWITSLLTAHDKAKHALKALELIREKSAFGNWMHPLAKMTIKTLLALAWAACNDDKSILCSRDDARNSILNALYEIQRDRAMGDDGVDIGSKVQNVCQTGAFNKVIESLISIHPDVSIRQRLKKLADLKLPIIVKQIVSQHIKREMNYLDHQSIKQLFLRLDKQRIEVIFDQIREQVIEKLMDEFGSAWDHDRNNRHFQALLGVALDVDISKIISSHALVHFRKIKF